MKDGTYLFAFRRQKIDERLNNVFRHRKTFLFSGFVETQVHEEGRGVLEAVGGGRLDSIEMTDQPFDDPAGDQLFANVTSVNRKANFCLKEYSKTLFDSS